MSAKVQATFLNNVAGGATTIPLATWGASLTVGNVIVAIFGFDRTAGTTVNSVTDTQGNAFTFVAEHDDTTDNQAGRIYMAPVTASGTAGPVANLAASNSFRIGAAVELSGITGYTVDQTGAPTRHQAATTAADNATTSTITPSVNGAVVIATGQNDAGGTIAAGTGFALDASATGTVGIERVDQGTAASIAPKFTLGTAGAWSALAFSLKPGAAASVTTSTFQAIPFIPVIQAA